MDKFDYVTKLPFWSKLTKNEKNIVTDNFRLVHFDKGRIFDNNGKSRLGFFFVLNGNIRGYLPSADGREASLFMLREADACVLSSTCVFSQIKFDILLIAETDLDMIVIPEPVIHSLVDKNIFVQSYIQSLALERFGSMIWMLQKILFEGVDKRISSFLIEEFDKTQDPKLIITQEEIAKRISSAREVVARTLKRFSDVGLVELKRGSVIIKEAETLRLMAGSKYFP